jgi:hypothetical protein
MVLVVEQELGQRAAVLAGRTELRQKRRNLGAAAPSGVWPGQRDRRFPRKLPASSAGKEDAVEPPATATGHRTRLAVRRTADGCWVSSSGTGGVGVPLGVRLRDGGPAARHPASFGLRGQVEDQQCADGGDKFGESDRATGRTVLAREEPLPSLRARSQRPRHPRRAAPRSGRGRAAGAGASAPRASSRRSSGRTSAWSRRGLRRGCSERPPTQPGSRQPRSQPAPPQHPD